MKLIAANWKLNKTPLQSREFLKQLLAECQFKAEKEMIIFPPATNLEAVSSEILPMRNNGISFGVQNCCFESKGAFTGETSAQTAKELGAQWVLVGHSERRKIFQETDEWLSKKVALAQSLGMKPMLCIGETLEERESGQTDSVNRKQLTQGLALADKNKPLAIAYEPVWAIGTGKVATIDQVKQAHAKIYEFLVELGFSQRTPILYGGSVKGDNAKELGSIPHVDGFLIGGASLEVKSYLEIYNA